VLLDEAGQVITPGRICRSAILLAVVGVFGTWRSAASFALDGLEGPNNGWIVLLFAPIALAGVGSLVRRGWLGMITVLGAASAMLYGALVALADGGSGWGLWLTTAASVLLACVALLAAADRIKGSTPADPRTSP